MSDILDFSLCVSVTTDNFVKTLPFAGMTKSGEMSFLRGHQSESYQKEEIRYGIYSN